VNGLATRLEERRVGGRKLLVPYVMGGIPDRASFPRVMEAASEHADALEIGLPYSDPLMDGPVIADAGERAMASGTGPLDALELAAQAQIGAPKIAMTYYNPIHRIGEVEFCERAAAAGFAGLIVPDIPVEESESLRKAAADHALAWIPLVAPTSSARPPPVLSTRCRPWASQGRVNRCRSEPPAWWRHAGRRPIHRLSSGSECPTRRTRSRQRGRPTAS
jgi:tryptophan synthase alpha subunit